jgi:endoglucanase
MIKRPTGWDDIVAFSRGRAKPSPEKAQKAFNELLENIKLENCVFFPDVVNAIFRRVPVKVEAENYGHEGAEKSYFVKDANQKSKYYRTSEPVLVEPVTSARRRFRSEQSIRLQMEEWTAYTVNSTTAKDYKVIAKVKSEDAPSVFQFSIRQQEQTTPVIGGDWMEVDLGSVKLSERANRFIIMVKKGMILFDWFRFEEIKKN